MVSVEDKTSEENTPWNFNLPWQDGYSGDHFKSSKWCQLLIKFTKTFDPKEPVITVAANSKILDGLVNWLISVLVLQQHPPKNILVVTQNGGVCSLILTRQIPVHCLEVSLQSLRRRANSAWALMFVRMSVQRILNWLGYDLLSLDTDAVMLKNPIPLIEQNWESADVVGTFGGKFPFELNGKWGFVLCMGTVLIRSTPATGEGWIRLKGLKGGRGPREEERRTNRVHRSIEWQIRWVL